MLAAGGSQGSAGDQEPRGEERVFASLFLYMHVVISTCMFLISAVCRTHDAPQWNIKQVGKKKICIELDSAVMLKKGSFCSYKLGGAIYCI